MQSEFIKAPVLEYEHHKRQLIFVYIVEETAISGIAVLKH